MDRARVVAAPDVEEIARRLEKRGGSTDPVLSPTESGKLKRRPADPATAVASPASAA